MHLHSEPHPGRRGDEARLGSVLSCGENVLEVVRRVISAFTAWGREFAWGGFGSPQRSVGRVAHMMSCLVRGLPASIVVLCYVVVRLSFAAVFWDAVRMGSVSA